MRSIQALFVALALFACDKPDPRITGAVKDRLATEANAAIDVSSHDGIVTLRGHVATEAQRDRVETTAREIDGVLGVDDELEVGPPITMTVR